MAVKPYFDFSVSYDTGYRVLPQPRSATPSRKRRARRPITSPAHRVERNERPKRRKRNERDARRSEQPVPATPGVGDNSKRRRKPVIWDGDSECFDDLRYSPSAGGVFATFLKGGGQYFYPMSARTQRNGSVEYGDVTGEFFNASGLRD